VKGDDAVTAANGPVESEGPEREALAIVIERFEAYARDLETRLAHGARAGTAGERVREEAEALEAQYRRRIENAGDLSAAEDALASFKEEAQRLRP
jgi:hypothetical protein